MFQDRTQIARRRFVLVSFEGPDWYAWGGGLAERVTGMAACLAGRGFETHYFYLGDPRLPGTERESALPLFLHRWAQWLSAGCPGGVYAGEEAKQLELAKSLPRALLADVIRPALADGALPVVLAEEWQTAAFICALAAELDDEGLGNRVLLFWRTGSMNGLERVDWEQLARSARLTATTPELQARLREGGIQTDVLGPEPAALLRLLGVGSAESVRARSVHRSAARRNTPEQVGGGQR